MTDDRHRLILRAEVMFGGRRIVTRTREVSLSEVVVPLSIAPPPGEPVELSLSFPGLVEGFGVYGTVVAHEAGNGPGELPCATIRIDPDSDAFRRRLSAILSPDRAGRGDTTSNYRILIVEDNGMIGDMFSYGVSKYFKTRGGVTVDVAEDGAAAWDRLVASSYDLAIVDYYLPVVNGAQLISQIRGDERVAGLPVVAISVGGDDARYASMSAGADLFLDKPIVLRDLFATLDRLVMQRKEVSS
jgi:CheY-like chemotaxis protein